jgi:hypothetical protein
MMQLRKLPLQSGLHYGSVHKATKILKLHPHHVNVTHKLKKPDKKNTELFISNVTAGTLHWVASNMSECMHSECGEHFHYLI